MTLTYDKPLPVNKVLVDYYEKLVAKEYPVIIPGTSNHRVFALLYSLIRSEKPEIIFEYGTCHALGTGYMAQAVCDEGKGKVYTFDIESIQQTADLIDKAGLKDYVEMIVGDSSEEGVKKAKDLGRVDFIYIDADHSQRKTKEDFYSVVDYLSEGALVVFHDTDLRTVQRALADIKQDYPSWSYFQLYPTEGKFKIGILQKPLEQQKNLDLEFKKRGNQ